MQKKSEVKPPNTALVQTACLRRARRCRALAARTAAAQRNVERSASRSDRGDLGRGVTAGGVARR